MFDMTDVQKQAFEAATNGLSAEQFGHLVLFLVGVLALIWYLFVVTGSIKNNQRPMLDNIYDVGVATGILIAVGAMIYYI